MPSIRAVLLGLVISLAQVNAHFNLLYPTTVGFSDDDEGKAPCGGFTVSFDNATDFYVGGDAIALRSLHIGVNWLYRATLDTSVTSNFSNLLPIVAQSALGDFCETGVKVPASFAGQKGVIQVVQDATDGQLFQCAAVNFKAGANPSVPSACVNGTGVTATFTTDAVLAGLASSTATSGSQSSSSSSTSTSTSSSSSASPSKSKASKMAGEYALGSLFWVSVVGFGVVAVAFGL